MGWYHFFPAIVHGQNKKVVLEGAVSRTTLIFVLHGYRRRLENWFHRPHIGSQGFAHSFHAGGSDGVIDLDETNIVAAGIF